MTTNNKCNHAESIAKNMYRYYAATAHSESDTPIRRWADLNEKEQEGWIAVANTALPVIGKHALGDVRDYLIGQAKTSTGWRKWLYWGGGIIIAGLLVGGAATMSGCGHSVDVTQGKTVICKDGSCLVLEPGHLSYSQAQPVTDVPPVVQALKK